MAEGTHPVLSSENPQWQRLEHAVRECMEAHGFNVRFRMVFRWRERKYEVDVAAGGNGLLLAMDCKCYGRGRYRESALRGQCATHVKRCAALSMVEGVPAYPVVVTLLDDGMLFENGCLVVPFEALDDFAMRLEEYLDMLPAQQTPGPG